MSLKQIKAKIKAVNKTHQVAKAMEAVSAAKMRKSQEKALTLRPYALSAFNILYRVSRETILKHPLLDIKSEGKTLVIVIVSDRGLAGNLNSGVLRKVVSYFRENNLSPVNSRIIVHGRKAAEFFGKRGFEILHKQSSKADYPNISEIDTVVDISSKEYLKGEYKEVLVAYPHFISTFEQQPTLHKIFPISEGEVLQFIKGIASGKKGSEFIEDKEEKLNSPYVFEPNETAVLDSAIMYLAKVLLYHALLESKASEFSARMVAMKNAQDKAEELSQSLNTTFNKIRQGAITREISEIVGGIESMK